MGWNAVANPLIGDLDTPPDQRPDIGVGPVDKREYHSGGGHGEIVELDDAHTLLSQAVDPYPNDVVRLVTHAAHGDGNGRISTFEGVIVKEVVAGAIVIRLEDKRGWQERIGRVIKAYIQILSRGKALRAVAHLVHHIVFAALHATAGLRPDARVDGNGDRVLAGGFELGHDMFNDDPADAQANAVAHFAIVGRRQGAIDRIEIDQHRYRLVRAVLVNAEINDLLRETGQRKIFVRMGAGRGVRAAGAVRIHQDIELGGLVRATTDPRDKGL